MTHVFPTRRCSGLLPRKACPVQSDNGEIAGRAEGLGTCVGEQVVEVRCPDEIIVPRLQHRRQRKMTISQLRPGDHRRDECLAIFLGWIRGLEQRRILLGRSCRRQSVHRCNVRVEPTLYRRVCTVSDCLSRQLALRAVQIRSEEHTSDLQSLMRISYAVFCLKKKTN